MSTGDAVVPAPRVRRGRTPSAAVERGLLSAAEAILEREGPSGLTIRAVAAAAGVAQMGVYSRLGGKDGMVDALLTRGFDRLRAALESGDEPDVLARLRSCSLRYREFALANPHFYAIMFEDAIPRERDSPEVREHARACFGVLVRTVELAAAAGMVGAPDPLEAAQQMWSAVHGAVALELKGLVLTPDAEATYRALIETMVRGLAPVGNQGKG
ncbi:MAG: TetR/AcrR family transcriptional regulator [Trebonia sp.]